jgi:glycosyltransferase, family 1
LVAAGHDVVVLSVDLRSIRRRRKWGLRSYERDGVRVEEINIPVGAVPKPLMIRIGTSALRKLLKRAISKFGEPDIVHSHFYDISYMTLNALDGKYKHAITEHSSYINSDLSDKEIYKYGEMYRKADLVIAVSRSLCKRMDEIFGISPLCINNIVDTDVFKVKASSVNESQKPFRFVSVSNLVPQKRIDLVVSALSELVKAGKPANLIIVGDGQMRASIEAQIEELGLGKHVRMIGKVDREEICKQLSDSDCFVLASQSETFGVSYIEAIASGLPVIASKCGGPEDFVNEENGILIEKDNLEELVKAMLFMYENARYYDHKKISMDISERFCAEMISKEIINAYASIK